MRQNRIIGLTGSIATGKSELSNILRQKGFYLIDSDEIAKEVANRDELIEKVRETFGKNAIRDGKFNREFLSNEVFSNKEKLKALNEIMHPTIFCEILNRIKPHEINFIDVPLLFETISDAKKYGLNYDKIMLVYAPYEIQLERLMKRDEITEDIAKKRISSQMSIEDKKYLADIVIDNSFDLSQLRENVENALKEIK